MATQQQTKVQIHEVLVNGKPFPMCWPTHALFMVAKRLNVALGDIQDAIHADLLAGIEAMATIGHEYACSFQDIEPDLAGLQRALKFASMDEYTVILAAGSPPDVETEGNGQTESSLSASSESVPAQ